MGTTTAAATAKGHTRQCIVDATRYPSHKPSEAIHDGQVVQWCSRCGARLDSVGKQLQQHG